LQAAKIFLQAFRWGGPTTSLT